jgi:hypothetical protein
MEDFQHTLKQFGLDVKDWWTGGLWWTMVDWNSDSSLFEHPIKLDNKPVRHLMVSGITNGGTQHPSILPIFSAHCIPLLVGESSQLCTHSFG